MFQCVWPFCGIGAQRVKKKKCPSIENDNDNFLLRIISWSGYAYLFVKNLGIASIKLQFLFFLLWRVTQSRIIIWDLKAKLSEGYFFKTRTKCIFSGWLIKWYMSVKKSKYSYWLIQWSNWRYENLSDKICNLEYLWRKKEGVYHTHQKIDYSLNRPLHMNNLWMYEENSIKIFTL